MHCIIIIIKKFELLVFFKNVIHFTGPGEHEPANLPVGMSVNHLCKTYKKGSRSAVRDVNMTFYRGQISALLGQNGAGKTTTMYVITIT